MREYVPMCVVDVTPVRNRRGNKPWSFVRPPLFCISLLIKGTEFHGLYAGDYLEAFECAADLSSQLNIHYVTHPYRSVLSQASLIYDDLWTAAKAMYKIEPVVADGGEVIIYAPHIREVSYGIS